MRCPPLDLALYSALLKPCLLFWTLLRKVPMLSGHTARIQVPGHTAQIQVPMLSGHTARICVALCDWLPV